MLSDRLSRDCHSAARRPGLGGEEMGGEGRGGRERGEEGQREGEGGQWCAVNATSRVSGCEDSVKRKKCV